MAPPNSLFPPWQDNEIRFDTVESNLKARDGERIIDYLDAVEDTKGNNGEMGRLTVTNLRLIWHAEARPFINLSIGLNNVLSVTTKTAQSALRGETQALFVLTKHNSTRYEFIFTNLVAHNPRLFTTVQTVHRAYDTSRMYRELKLRGSIIRDKQLVVLPAEQIYDKVVGVWNLSNDQGILGSFVITNVRVVWHANINENFNISVPYIQMRAVRTRELKYGLSMAIITSMDSGNYVLAFRVDPPERLKEVAKQIKNLYKVCGASPVFGVFYEVDDPSISANSSVVQSGERPNADEEDEDADEDGVIDDGVDPLAAYYADNNKVGEGRVVTHPGLGLAIEELPRGVTLESLWTMSL
eukprot:Opistho-2@841